MQPLYADADHTGQSTQSDLSLHLKHNNCDFVGLVMRRLISARRHFELFVWISFLAPIANKFLDSKQNGLTFNLPVSSAASDNLDKQF